MRIDGITCCVGELYAKLLRRSLPIWMETLDSLMIVTDEAAPIVRELSDPGGPTLKPQVYFVETDVLTARGAHFNKGAALNVAYTAAAPTDWVLSLDADIEPPADWRTVAEPLLEPGKLYGCRRVNGRRVNCRRAFVPYGYFQLWHSSDPHAVSSPPGPFAECYAHAGRYDARFIERWPVGLRSELPFRVLHHGTPLVNWFGVGNEHLMGPLLAGGVEAYRARDEKLWPVSES